MVSPRLMVPLDVRSQPVLLSRIGVIIFVLIQPATRYLRLRPEMEPAQPATRRIRQTFPTTQESPSLTTTPVGQTTHPRTRSTPLLRRLSRIPFTERVSVFPR